MVKQMLREAGILGEESKNEVKAVKELQEALEKIKEPKGEQAYYSAIELFDAVSKYQDVTTGKNPFPKRFAEQYALLQSHTRNAGRSEYGINRTKAGERVDGSNTYWGDIYGIWTFNTNHFLTANSKFAHPGLKKEFEGITIKDVIAQDQVRPFVKSHLDPMKELTKDLVESRTKDIDKYYEK
ncbi:MAG: hypothetical protein FWE47_02120 [Oscillospiraceae bacterium]|nr:hypothetical protein [Oscillospiraceae bacterium]